MGAYVPTPPGPPEGDAGDLFTNLFRAVNPAEYQQIERTGTFELGRYSAGKYFWFTMKDALWFADREKDIAGIVMATIGTAAVDIIGVRLTMDGRNAFFVPQENLPALNASLIGPIQDAFSHEPLGPLVPPAHGCTASIASDPGSCDPFPRPPFSPF